MKKAALAKKGRKLITYKELLEMGLFDLSIHALMPEDVFRVIKSRLEVLQDALDTGDVGMAKIIVNKLLLPPQRREV